MFVEGGEEEEEEERCYGEGYQEQRRNMDSFGGSGHLRLMSSAFKSPRAWMPHCHPTNCMCIFFLNATWKLCPKIVAVGPNWARFLNVRYIRTLKSSEEARRVVRFFSFMLQGSSDCSFGMLSSPRRRTLCEFSRRDSSKLLK